MRVLLKDRSDDTLVAQECTQVYYDTDNKGLVLWGITADASTAIWFVHNISPNTAEDFTREAAVTGFLDLTQYEAELSEPDESYNLVIEKNAPATNPNQIYTRTKPAPTSKPESENPASKLDINTLILKTAAFLAIIWAVAMFFNEPSLQKIAGFISMITITIVGGLTILHIINWFIRKKIDDQDPREPKF